MLFGYSAFLKMTSDGQPRSSTRWVYSLKIDIARKSDKSDMTLKILGSFFSVKIDCRIVKQNEV